MLVEESWRTVPVAPQNLAKQCNWCTPISCPLILTGVGSSTRVISCCHPRLPGPPAPCPTTALALIGAWERGGNKSSSLCCWHRRRQQVRRDFPSHQSVVPVGLLWGWRPRSILASGGQQGGAELKHRPVPPSCCLLWHFCPLERQNPISKWNVVVSNMQTNRPCSLPSGLGEITKKSQCPALCWGLLSGDWVMLSYRSRTHFLPS